MSKSIQSLPCEEFINRCFNDQWRNFSDRDKDGALGLAIVKSVYDGVPPDLYSLSTHLGLHKDFLWRSYRRLSMNGVFLRHNLHRIEKESASPSPAWLHYAGLASGYTGSWLPDEDLNVG